MRRPSARVLITTFAVLVNAAVVLLLVAVVQHALADNPAALEDATAAAWTIATLLIILTAFAGWTFATYLLRPLWDMRRDLRLTARSRALAESYWAESEDIAILRETLVNVLRDLEEDARNARTETRQVLSMIGEASEGIVQVADNGRFLNVNRAARTLLALPPQSEGRTIASLIRHRELRDIMQRAAEGETVEPAEILFDNRQLLIATRPLADDRGGAVVTVVDLTELRRLETVRRDFVANVSHELKTPLTVIRGYAETLLDDDMKRADQLEFLEVIHKNAQRLQRIVEDLLDLSRLQSGGWSPDLQSVEVAALADEVWLSCEPAATRARVSFSVTGGPAFVRADPGGLRQVLSNVYDNALRYTGGNGRIETRIRCEGDQVSIEIADNGAGIPAASLPRIFERFYRVDTARSRAEGGTGLGLSIVKHLMERMQGSVSATSALGVGTTLRLQLPKATTP